MHTGKPLGKLSALIELVNEKARGVFIWVRLVVDELARGVRDGTPLSELEASVSNMPPELRDLYSRTLSRIEESYAEESYIMLQIALCCLQPLYSETFLNCTNYIKRGKVTEEFESQADMIRRLKSRSGGLLEIASTTASGAAQVDENGCFQEAEQIKLTALTSSALLRREEGEMYPKVVEPSRPIVQLIHQTVKEFVRDCREKLGLPKVNKSNTAITNESGHLLLIRCGARLENDWADRIRRDIFIYAHLAETDRAEVYRTLQRLVPPFQGRMETHTLAGLLSPTHFESYFYLLPSRIESEIFINLAVAAKLLGYVRSYFENTRYGLSRQTRSDLLQVAILRPKIVPGQGDRLAMLKLLLRLGISADSPVNVLPFIQTNSDFRVVGEYTILTVLLAPTNNQSLTEQEHFLIAKVLLEGGADYRILNTASVYRSPVFASSRVLCSIRKWRYDSPFSAARSRST